MSKSPSKDERTMEKVWGVILDVLRKENIENGREVIRETRLEEDLDVDSVDLLQIKLGLEEGLGLEISDQEFQDFLSRDNPQDDVTLGQIEDFLAKKAGEEEEKKREQAV